MQALKIPSLTDRNTKNWYVRACERAALQSSSLRATSLLRPARRARIGGEGDYVIGEPELHFLMLPGVLDDHSRWGCSLHCLLLSDKIQMRATAVALTLPGTT